MGVCKDKAISFINYDQFMFKGGKVEVVMIFYLLIIIPQHNPIVIEVLLIPLQKLVVIKDQVYFVEHSTKQSNSSSSSCNS
ncbi:UNKNOWN [Stylonychia lemnae]|uniref:Uncharacterized protein n=1 Tax=Stylonychia lemnae TaxID=5949 RepID=A0A078ANX8_STYLE|nr:UNKNOWN [Stylonychia lemnae]|eukprot:CDW84075.1 UNKNOWN [Stylonychia lemnae]